MKRLTMAAPICALALLGFVSSATAGDKPKPNNVAAKICAAEKHADKAAFEATYGKHAMRECKRAHRDEAGAAIENASQQCRAEQAADPVAFDETYGSNGNGKNAFGKCVSAKAREQSEEDGAAFANAAQECRAERAADPEAFTATYGSNRNGRNAFGKCVSQRVHEDEADTPAV